MNNRHIFAAYINQASHNFHLLLNDISQSLDKTSVDDENLQSHPVIHLLQNPKEARRSLRAINALNKGFAFTVRLQRRIMAYRFLANKAQVLINQGKKKPQRKPQEYSLLPEDYAHQIKLFARTLNEVRNQTTHSYHQMHKPDEALINFLYDIFDMALRVIKTRHQITNQDDVKHLRRKIRNPDKSNNAVKVILDPKFKYAFLNKDGYFSDYGLAFFTCLFLSKQDSYQFLKQISGFKNSNTTAYKATLWVFSCFSLRLPNERIDNSVDTQTLGLDMVNELARCPSLLYPILPKSEQELYKIALDINEEQNASDDGSALLFIRHDERFIALMMRYFDETHAFESLRFQIDLGDFYFAAYPKTLYDDINETRRLKQKLLTFARLNEVESSPIPQQWQALIRDSKDIDENDLSPYLVDTTAHYHLLDDNIAIKLTTLQTKIYPELKTNTLIQNRYLSPANPVADFWLSKHEMLHIGFYHLLLQRHKELPKLTIEHVFEEYKKTLHNFFDHIAQNPQDYASTEALKTLAQNYTYSPLKQTLMLDEVPSVIKASLLQQASKHQNKSLATITNLLEIGDKRLAALERSISTDKDDKSTRAGDKKQRPVKAGIMADHLAQDIVRLQPPQDDTAHKGKPTSLIVSELQARLAFYGRDKAQLPALCKAMKLIENSDSSKNHPFLASVLAGNHLGIIGFYQSYYKARAVYLNRVFIEIKQQPTAHYHWLKTATRDKADFSLQSHIAKLKQQPLNLPRGLFFPYIKHALLQLKHATLTQAINQSPRLNSSYLIALYYQHVLQDQSQAVYEKSREYKIIAQAYDTRQGKAKFQALAAHPVDTQQTFGQHNATQQKIKQHLQTKYKDEPKTQQLSAYRQFEKNEKNIREIRSQDQVLFLASQQLLALNQGLNSHISKLKLHQLDKDILDAQTPYQLSIHGKTIQQAAIRVKKIGEFRRFLKDRRLKGLLSYYGQTEIAREIIAKELEEYQRLRLEIFEVLHQFESNSFQQYGLDADYQGSEHGKLLSAYFKANPQADSQAKIHCMLILRNAFAHNQYPTFEPKYPLADNMIKAAIQELHQQHAPKVALYFTQQFKTLYPLNQTI
ncbi:MAG: type VI-B CRISPR-associated RNA-guided ribonuclease Cas13b [Methylophilus sp.]|jgi:hypothetical protein